MKLLLKICAGVIALVVLALVVVNLLISADAVRDRVAARVKEQSGRDLTVHGSSSLLLMPSPHIVLTDVEITDPENRAGADLTVARLALDVSFGQLFSRQVDADRVVMERPVLTVRLKDGAQQQGDAGPLAPMAPTRAAAAAPFRFIAAEAGGGSSRRDVMLRDVRIEDGTVRIIYNANGDERRIEHIDAALSLPHLVDPLTAKGDFDWKGLRVGFDLKLEFAGRSRHSFGAARPCPRHRRHRRQLWRLCRGQARLQRRRRPRREIAIGAVGARLDAPATAFGDSRRQR